MFEKAKITLYSVLAIRYSMEFKRHIAEQLESWRRRKRRKPLIIRGARQVGKTTLVKSFALRYKYQVILNLERPEDLRWFQDYASAGTLVDALFYLHGIPHDAKQDTLLFIDEIQESPAAIALLRYFYEDVPELPVIAAGSLLEHAMSQVNSFPVGRVEFLYMAPLNFSEYLAARGHEGLLTALETVPSVEAAHLALLTKFHDYAIIGGMPEVTVEYLETEAISALPPIYEGIWGAYRDDVEKYAETKKQAQVISHLMVTAASHLDQRIKFAGFGNSAYGSREVGEAFRHLQAARLIQLVYPTTDRLPPVLPDLKKRPRLQFLDTGLVNHDLGIQAHLLKLEDMSQAFKGRLIPHLVTQELISLQSYAYKLPHFWVREKAQSSAEVDLVVPHGDKVIPIEIKSGKTGTLKSLHQFIETCDHPYAVRIYAGKFSIEEHTTPNQRKPYFLMNLPYYLGTQLTAYLDYFVQQK